jgi:hypothetical protein
VPQRLVLAHMESGPIFGMTIVLPRPRPCFARTELTKREKPTSSFLVFIAKF